MLFTNVEVAGRTVDVRLGDGLVQEIGALRREPGEHVLDGHGGALLPGLTEHHVHLFAWAAARLSVRCGPPAVRTGDQLGRALAAAPSDARGWVRGVGYTESVAGLLDAAVLDRLHASRPVRVQHRSGSLWVLNTAAIRELHLGTNDDPGIERDDDGNPTGRLWRADRLLRALGSPPDLGPVARMLVSWGITTVTDASPDLPMEALHSQLADGTLPHRVQTLATESPPPHERLWAGPAKIIIRDDRLPGLEELTAAIRCAREAGRAVAVHCVTVEALLLLLAAFDETGTIDGDRIEHAAIVPDHCLQRIRRHGLRVVTQPGFLAQRGEQMLGGLEKDEHDDLYRYGSLLRAGIPAVPSSDAPYGPADPWQIIAAARDRTTEEGRPVTPGESVDAGTALRGYLTPADLPSTGPRLLCPGAPADLVLLDADLATVLRRPRSEHVRATMIGGRLVWNRDDT